MIATTNNSNELVLLRTKLAYDDQRLETPQGKFGFDDPNSKLFTILGSRKHRGQKASQSRITACQLVSWTS